MSHEQRDAISRTPKPIRRSISISPELDRKVQGIVRHEKTSTNRAIEKLIEAGLEAREAEKKRFLQLAESLRESKDSKEVARIKEELARMVFGS